MDIKSLRPWPGTLSLILVGRSLSDSIFVYDGHMSVDLYALYIVHQSDGCSQIASGIASRFTYSKTAATRPLLIESALNTDISTILAVTNSWLISSCLQLCCAVCTISSDSNCGKGALAHILDC